MVAVLYLSKDGQVLLAWVDWNFWEAAMAARATLKSHNSRSLVHAGWKRRGHLVRSLVALTVCMPALLGCATQRYGRQSSLSAVEYGELTCREIRIEMAKSQEFVTDVRRQRSDTNGAHVLGFLGDFGIGNVMEGNEAEASGASRMSQLRTLAAQRNCSGQTIAGITE